MAKYLFVNVPAYGHVNPTLPIVRELVARGESVAYYLTEEFRSAVEAVGARLLPYQPFGGKPASGGKPAFEGPFEMLERVRQEQPDCIVYDAMHLWARTVAEALRIPAVLSCPSFVGNEHFNPLKDHFNLLGEKIAAPMSIPPQALEKIQGVINLIRQKYQLSAFDMSDFYGHTEALNLVYMPRAFHPSAELFDERYVFVGPPLLRTAESVGEEEKQTLYISLGTVYNDRPEFFQQCFAAFAQGPWQVVLSHGKRGEGQELAGVPENFDVRAYVEQWQVLPRTDVFITHGGMSSVMESLYYGVPMVVLPQQAEQQMTARRLAELGLAVVLDTDTVNVQHLRDTVEAVSLNEALRERCQAMKQIVRAAGGAQGAADAVMQFTHSRLSVTRA